MNRALLASGSDEWGTPRPFYEWLDAQLHFTVDVCASPTNRKHPRFWTRRDNGLVQSWEGETAWCNPPYGRAIGEWVRRARDAALRERAFAALLVPARVDTDWWRTYVMTGDRAAGRLVRSCYVPDTGVWWLRWEGLVTGIYHHPERLAFEGADTEDGAPFPSSVVLHLTPTRRPVVRRQGLLLGVP